jgi:hypothetical protein
VLRQAVVAHLQAAQVDFGDRRSGLDDERARTLRIDGEAGVLGADEEPSRGRPSGR